MWKLTADWLSPALILRSEEASMFDYDGVEHRQGGQIRI